MNRECLKPGSASKPKFRVVEPESLETSAMPADYNHYRANPDELLPRYAGKYVAIINHAIVDSDDDERVLRERLSAKYGDTPATVNRVTAGPQVFRDYTAFTEENLHRLSKSRGANVDGV